MQISSWVLGSSASSIQCSPFRGAPPITPAVTCTRQNLLLRARCTRLPCNVIGTSTTAATKSRRTRATTTLALQKQQQLHRPRTPDTHGAPPTAPINGDSQPKTQPSPEPRSAATEGEDDDGADRMFAAARALHLRRHRSDASRANALGLLREALRLRPGWKETDSRFAVDSGIDDVFEAFSLPRDFVGEEVTAGVGGSSSNRSTTKITDCAVRCAEGGAAAESSVGSARSSGGASRDDVVCLRKHLDTWGYNARTVQERFGVGGANRLPGPYYLRKSLDHKQAAMVSGMGRPKDPLDVAIRLFLLGLALPRAQAERSLGSDFLDAASRLGMLGECPIDPLLVVSLVQLFPLDAEAVLPSTLSPGAGGTGARVAGRKGAGEAPATTVSQASLALSVAAPSSSSDACGKEGRYSASVGGSGGDPNLRMHDRADTIRGTRVGASSCDRGGDGGRAIHEEERMERRQGVCVETPSREATVRRNGNLSARRMRVGRPPELKEKSDDSTSAGAIVAGAAVAASEMIFATDWPPPGSTALTEDPVMYIGPDSIGLVQHAPSARAPAPARAPRPIPSRSDSHHHCHHIPRHERLADEEQEEEGREMEHVSRGRTPRPAHENVMPAAPDLSPSRGAGGARGTVEGASPEPFTTAAATDPPGGENASEGTELEMPPEGDRRQGEGYPKREQRAKRGGPRYDEWSSGRDGGGSGKNGQGKPRAEEILDLCCGSGVQGIAAAVLRRGEASVTCVDISPRAVRFARFNALLNGLQLDAGERSEDGPEEEGQGCFRAVVGDLYDALVLPVVEGGHAAIAASQRCGPGQSISVEGVTNVSHLDSGKTATRSVAPPRAPVPGRYDLILANPPFVPVPPRLGAVRRRYDLFASGGSSGEEVIERIFRGAVDHLRPGGGVLAVVTELANPRTFDAKLRRWAGGAVAPKTRPRQKGDDGDGDGRRDDEDSVGGGGSASFPAWTGVVLHERQPWTAREYAARRAGSPGEVEGWERHLRDVVGIEEMSAGFVFVHRGSVGVGGGGGSRVEVRGVEKLWAPHNRGAIEHTRRVLDEL
ncbi:unnamed protein product [Scytosiphon promiscuus]